MTSEAAVVCSIRALMRRHTMKRVCARVCAHVCVPGATDSFIYVVAVNM